MPCGTCGSRITRRVSGPRGADGSWSLRWPGGALQPFGSEAEARAYAEKHPGVAFDLVPPDTAEGP